MVRLLDWFELIAVAVAALPAWSAFAARVAAASAYGGASRRDSAAWVGKELAAGDHYRAQGLSCEDCGSSSHAEAGP